MIAFVIKHKKTHSALFIINTNTPSIKATDPSKTQYLFCILLPLTNIIILPLPKRIDSYLCFQPTSPLQQSKVQSSSVATLYDLRKPIIDNLF